MRLQFSFQLRFVMTLLLIWTIDIVNSYPQWHRSRPPANFNNPSVIMEKAKTRRGMSLDMNVAKKKPALELEFLQELEKLLNDTKIIPSKDFCPDCNAILKDKTKQNEKRQEVKPAYNCDQWDPKTRTCWVDRNIGNTVTFVLTLPSTENKQFLPKVEWKQVFQTLRSNRGKHYNIDTNNPPWNIVVGSAGYELRLSPITEVDVDFNFFVAIVHSEDSTPISQRTVRFRIRVMPIDQGLVYPGASLLINMFTFVSLPEESITFRWNLEKEPDNSLPSNMRLSMSGGVLSISELRKEQEGIVVCSVFTNLGIFATQKRFLIRGVDQDNNLLVFMATRPPYQHDGRRKREVKSADYTKDPKSYAGDDNLPWSRVQPEQESSIENGDEEFDENGNLQHDGRHTMEVESIDYTKDPKSYAEENNLPWSRIQPEQESSVENGAEEFVENGNFQHDGRHTMEVESIDYTQGSKSFTKDYSFPTSIATSHPKPSLENGVEEFDENSNYQHDGRRKREVESIDYTKDDSKSSAEDDNPPRSRARSRQKPSLDNDDEEFDENSNRNVENARGPSRNKGSAQKENNDQQESNSDLYPNSEGEQSDQNRRSQNGLNQLPDTKNSNAGSSSDDSDSDILYRSDGQLEEPSKNFSRNRVPRPNVIESDSKEMVQQNSKPSPGHYSINQDRVRDVDDILAVEVKIPNTETLVRVSDEISILLAECRRNTQCSTYAECIKMDDKKAGFCRCLSRFEGSGIFCWEVYKIRT